MSSAQSPAENPPPKATVVVPTCNRSDAIDRCLAALADQTFADFEAIVVDDGSGDRTAEVLAGAAERFAALRLHILTNPTNRGANPSRNRAVCAASGEIIAFLDDDAVPRPDWLAQLLAAFEDPAVAAAVGGVDEPPPSNIWEMALRGTHRVGDKPGPAPRLVGCNMAIRRELLLTNGFDDDYGWKDRSNCPDVSVSGRSDEEGIYLKLRAGDHQVVIQPRARVTHNHRYTRKSFFGQAYRGGRSAARLVHKFHLPHRLDMMPFLLAYGSAPLTLFNPLLLPLPPLFFTAGLAAITYNDLFRKKKTPIQTLVSFPALLGYYHIRLFGYTRQTFSLKLKPDQLERARLR